MTDIMTASERSRCMAAVKGKNTRPEMIVRRYLFSRGLRYRVNVGRLPGSPDIVLKKYRTAIFIDGCFWHAHRGCRYYKLPKTNTQFWRQKVMMNMARDYRVNVELRCAGWRVIRIWECELRGAESREKTLRRLYDFITGEGSGGSYETPMMPDALAGEPEGAYGKHDDE